MKMLAYKFHGAPTAETKKQAWRNTPRQQQTARRLTQRYIYKHLSFYFYFSVERLAKKMEKIESNNLVSPVVTRRSSLVFFFFVSLFTVQGAVLKERWPGLGGKNKQKHFVMPLSWANRLFLPFFSLYRLTFFICFSNPYSFLGSFVTGASVSDCTSIDRVCESNYIQTAAERLHINLHNYI